MSSQSNRIGEMDNETKQTVKHLAQTNLRGITSADIVCEIQSIREQPIEEIDADHRFYLGCRFTHLLNELERRTRLNDTGVRTTNKEIIQTIKERVPIDTVLAWYTDVFIYKSKWTYRCTLHGLDKHPSGVIYQDEGRFHCFACGAHGDIFDAVQLFERMELIEAVKKLANYIGLEIKPFETKPTNSDDRLRQVELKTNHLLKGNKNAKKKVYNTYKE